MKFSGINSMLFTTGSAYNTAKFNQMQLKFEQKKQNIEKDNHKEEELTPKQQEIQRITEQMAEIREGNKVSAITSKLDSGAELSEDELEYLKAENPELYKKAIEVKREKEQYKKALEGCNSKEDVEQVRSNRLQNFMSEVNNVKNNSNIKGGKKKELLDQINRRLMGVLSVHSKFLTSKAYRDLPNTNDDEKTKKTIKSRSIDVEELFTELKIQSASIEVNNNASKSRETKNLQKDSKSVNIKVKVTKINVNI